MMRSTTAGKRPIRLWAVAVWLLVWQAASWAVGQEILLASPLAVLVRLGELVQEATFWHAILFSFVRIVSGFLLALLTGCLLAAIASFCGPVRDLLEPLLLTVKSVPVASFVILCLIWIPSRNLSVFISFLMVLPIIYTNLLEGIRSTDPQLLEMAELFGVPPLRRIRYIYLSQVLPYLRSAVTVSLGLCWKAGAAAEVIGIPKGSIGEHLYQAKIYLDTPDLFAWTVVILLVSLLFERLFLFGLHRLLQTIERM